MDPYVAEAHARLGFLLHWQRQRSEAMAEFDQAFELVPWLPDFHYMIALTHDGRSTEAIEFMERCRRRDPLYAPAWDAGAARRL